MAEERKGGKDSDQELDDWAAAIDEWDANLALPKSEAKSDEQKTPAPEPPPKPVAPPPMPMSQAARQHAPTPSGGISIGPHDPMLTPLPPPPGTSLPDPLMQLFDGDMELPEEAGQALGTLLGD